MKICSKCQLRSTTRVEEKLYPTHSITIQEKVGLNIVYILSQNEYQYLILARDDLNGQIEDQTLQNAIVANIANFLYTEIIYRYDLFNKLIMNRGSKNKEKINQTIKLLLLNKITTSLYYSQANEIIEYSHKPIVDTLTKIKGEGRRN